MPDNNDWLLSAESDEERFRRLQRQLRGFDQPMWEVGERFESLHDALLRNNFGLALYHWDKIATTIRTCMGCHVAEGVAYMNDQALFDLQRPEAERADRSK